MEDHSILLERMDGNIKRLVEDVERIESKLPHIEERVSHVERAQIKSRAWFGGMAAAAAATSQNKQIQALVAWFMPTFLFLGVVVGLALSLAGCPLPETHGYRWPKQLRPVKVLVSATLAANCVNALNEGLAFWAKHGVNYLQVEYNVPEARTQRGALHPGQIGVTSLPPAIGRLLGTTTPDPGLVKSLMSEIRFNPEVCGVGVARHELGHALGLRHLEEEGNVMNPTLKHGGEGLQDWQLHAVR